MAGGLVVARIHQRCRAVDDERVSQFAVRGDAQRATEIFQTAKSVIVFWSCGWQPEGALWLPTDYNSCVLRWYPGITGSRGSDDPIETCRIGDVVREDE